MNQYRAMVRSFFNYLSTLRDHILNIYSNVRSHFHRLTNRRGEILLKQLSELIRCLDILGVSLCELITFRMSLLLSYFYVIYVKSVEIMKVTDIS